MHCDKRTDHPTLDLNPSFLEVQAAKDVFRRRLSSFADEVNRGAMRPETALVCALAEVWRQARKHQRDQDDDALMALSEFGRRAASGRAGEEPPKAVMTAFDYGQAKGYRAAEAEHRKGALA